MVIPYILAFFAVFKISSGDVTGSGFSGFVRSVFVIAGFLGGATAWWTLLACVISLFRPPVPSAACLADQPTSRASSSAS